jgi:hypothetical protein
MPLPRNSERTKSGFLGFVLALALAGLYGFAHARVKRFHPPPSTAEIGLHIRDLLPFAVLVEGRGLFPRFVASASLHTLFPRID